MFKPEVDLTDSLELGNNQHLLEWSTVTEPL